MLRQEQEENSNKQRIFITDENEPKIDSNNMNATFELNNLHSNNDDDESDIEVLSVCKSKETKNNENVTSTQIKPINGALLSSITEQEVEYLINNNTNTQENTNSSMTIDKDFMQTKSLNESDASNYDLINDNSPEIISTKRILDSESVLITPESLPNQNSPETSNLNFSFMSPNGSTSEDKYESNNNSFDDSFDTSVKSDELLNHNVNSNSDDLNNLCSNTINFFNDASKLDNIDYSKPCFNSQLTNSQLSEELSQQIQLT